jgi:peptide/nickel transport system substrate-binding protein
LTLRLFAIFTIGLLGICVANGAQNRLSLGLQLEPPNLDPTSGAAAAIDEVVYGNIFEGLVRIDENGNVHSGLALFWEISTDKTTYVFHLAEAVKFHDGSDFDAEDVKFSFNRARAANSTNAKKYIFAPIVMIDVLDPLTIMITLDRPHHDFLFNIGLGDAIIVNKETALGNAFNPIGTGPFKFESWVRGYAINLVRNEQYWGVLPRLLTVSFKIITDPLSAYTALKAGDIDGFPNYPAPENISLFENDPFYTVEIGLTAGETILSTNNKKPPFDNILVRQAMAHAINRKELIDGAMFGYAEPIGSHFAPDHRDYVDLSHTYPYDLAKSKTLLKEAGYANGFKATLKLPPPIYARRTGELIAYQLRKVGIDLTIENMEWAQWIDQVLRNRNYDLTVVSHVEPLDIVIYADPTYYFGYDNAQMQKIITDLNNAQNDEDVRRLYIAVQRKIADDAVNGYLFQLGKYGIWNKKLKGLWKNYPIRSNDLRDVYFEE